MKIYIVTCTFNVSKTLVDCAFQSADDADAYVTEMNGDKGKAIARCKELIVRHEGEAMLPFLIESDVITFAVVDKELR